jgi:hypothetical protein
VDNQRYYSLQPVAVRCKERMSLKELTSWCTSLQLLPKVSTPRLVRPQSQSELCRVRVAQQVKEFMRRQHGLDRRTGGVDFSDQPVWVHITAKLVQQLNLASQGCRVARLLPENTRRI